jgi:hypothetical protein
MDSQKFLSDPSKPTTDIKKDYQKHWLYNYLYECFLISQNKLLIVRVCLETI